MDFGRAETFEKRLSYDGLAKTWDFPFSPVPGTLEVTNPLPEMRAIFFLAMWQEQVGHRRFLLLILRTIRQRQYCFD